MKGMTTFAKRSYGRSRNVDDRVFRGDCRLRIVIDWKKTGQEFAVLIVIGTFLTVIEPYGATSDLPLWATWIYWTGLIIYGSVIGMTTSHFVTKWLTGKPSALILFVIASVTALFVTPLLTVVHYLLGQSSAFADMHILYAFVWVISAGMTGIGWLLHLVGDRTEPPTAADTMPDSDQTIRSFMSRLPLPYRTADLYAVSSEDHYLRVHTSAGEHLFLERLGTVIHQLQGADGLQTHRSWWVAEQGVQSARSQNGRIILTLKSGVDAPVSRTFAPSIREAGWL